MNSQNTKKPTKAMRLWKNIFVLTVSLGIVFPILGKAESIEESHQWVGDNCLSVTNRPFSHFLDTQGTLHKPPLFFPHVKDYQGWTDNPQTNFALVDYAGLANKYIKDKTGHSIGTKVNGFILECALPNGKAQITVNLLTTRALGFAHSVQDLEGNNFNFLETPTNFGVKAQEVIAGKKPAIGPVIFSVTFSISTPGARLPDLLDVINVEPKNKYAPIKMSFKSTTFGKCPSGIKARLDVHQVASTNDSNALVFTKEKVKIVDSNGDQCEG